MTRNHEPTAEELNLDLYEKLKAEFAAYRAELLTLPAEEILEQAAGYVTREDILLSLEYNDLNRQQAEILLKSEHPLLDIYFKWESAEQSYSVRLKRGLGAYHEPQSDDEVPEYTISMLAELLDLL